MAKEERRQPPIGVHPEWLWKEQRARALAAAINRYIDEGFPVPEEWPIELTIRLKEMNERSKSR